jgi:acetyl-CoA carboxylase biotin carboxyl carrier protein
MTEPESQATPDEALLQSVWTEARDLVRKLEGSSVQRFAVAAGNCKIEIERGAVAAPEGGAAPSLPPADTGRESRVFSGSFAAIDPAAADNRIPVLAPLVGTFYAAAQPGAKPFVEVGDVVETGQTVCIVEAMKLMNEVAAAEGGKVVEICVKDGDPVEFDQVLIYLEPAGS